MRIDEATRYISMVQEGAAAIRSEPAPMPPPAPAPAVERRVIVVLQASKWMDAGEVRTAGRLSQADVPVTIAEQAVAIGNALPVDSDAYRRLREIEGVDHAPQLERDCFWLDRARPVPGQREPHVTVPVVHSGLPGARVGTAVALPK
jgi:hypothetical protein